MGLLFKSLGVEEDEDEAAAEEMLAGKSRAERVRGLGGKLRRKKKPGRTFDTNQDLADKWLAAEPHWAYG